VTFFRVAILAAMVGLLIVVVHQMASERVPPATEPVAGAPVTSSPTQVPLPTLAPAAIISRVARETPSAPGRVTTSAQPLVVVVDYGYWPRQLGVDLGASVTWTNDGNDGHDVTGSGPGGEWRSGPLAPAEHYSRQFSLAGTYDYACTLHPEMRGQVIVRQ
jgi:plastocyanin